ncbi:DUF202 domain-containing protein [Rhodococcus erythropolis]|uniref:DUF202 domain-containing protein n=1 Tax=Rhodococcus erythropolis TaxID=1833 RepID=UPI0009954448|nr:DUF202 domain-containing protein [Rhodococcus erythropolis]MBT1258321.1 DUF202 domain-containing protein [Rhodococcus erythropolis]MQP33262.1 DUF202 domain-containing protein [Rhodococcus erythropolis]
MSTSHSSGGGLQPERTSLSFVRTSLSILGLAAACLRWLPPSSSIALIGPAMAGALVVGATVHEHRSRTLRVARFAAEAATPAIVTGTLLVMSVVILGCTGLWIALW